MARFCRFFLDKGLFVLIACAVAWLMITPLRTAAPYAFYFDDFFYYLVPAKHFLRDGTFHFFPGMPTNGFQPLWMSVIVILLAICRQQDSAFFIVFNALITFLLLITYLQAAAVAKRLTPSRAMQQAAALFALLCTITIGYSGMEVVLAVPLLLWLFRLLLVRPLHEYADRQLFGLGLLGSAILLTRLDSGVFLLPSALLLLWLDRPSVRGMTLMALGLVPVLAYLALNETMTGSILPISGQAKQLKTSLFATERGLAAEFWAQRRAYAYAVLPPLLLFGAFRTHSETLNMRGRQLIVSVGAGAFLYYVTLALISGWLLWFWYIYPLLVVSTLALAMILRQASPGARWSAFGIMFVLLASLLAYAYQFSPSRNEIYKQSVLLQTFALSHPGRYAMGDRAGTPSYLMDRPVLQLEGLMGDQKFLDYIRRQAPLREALDAYAIDYYIATDPVRAGDCYEVREPSQAPATSKVMRGRICAAPLFAVPDEIGLFVFDARHVQ